MMRRTLLLVACAAGLLVTLAACAGVETRSHGDRLPSAADYAMRDFRQPGGSRVYLGEEAPSGVR